jgi:soluble lytic murein transglycosylase-like protein
VAGVALLAGLPSGTARSAARPTSGLSTAVVAGADVEAARAEARRAEAEVATLTTELRETDRKYAAGLAGVGRSVAESVLADAASDVADRRADQARNLQARSARALYMGGGQAGLMSSLLRAEDPQDLALRAVAVRQTLAGLRTSAGQAQGDAVRAAVHARGAEAGAERSVVVADDLAQRAAAVSDLLGRAQAALDRLSARARRLAEAERAALALAGARAEAAATRSSGLNAVRATLPPSQYMALYRSAAETCPGMRWTLLAAVGQVESGHGRNVGPSSAGAVGPMQFMPATFRGYAVDGDADGRTDPLSPADAIFTAARYLCEGGAGSPSGIRSALFRYNHASWYVDLVLRVEQQLPTA